MKISQNTNYISTDVQARIKPLTIPIIILELEEELKINIIKVEMQRNPYMATSETYNTKIFKF